MSIELDSTNTLLVASAVSFIVYNILFLAAQLWEAFATLFLGLYYIPLFQAIIGKRKRQLAIFLVLHLVATGVIFGLGIFFIVEIFINNSLVSQVLVYIKELSEIDRDNVAKYTSIAMAVESLLTAALHLSAFGCCFEEYRDFYHLRFSESPPVETIAIHTELDYPEPMMLPRLRTTSLGYITGDASKFPDKAMKTCHHSMPPPERF